MTDITFPRNIYKTIYLINYFCIMFLNIIWIDAHHEEYIQGKRATFDSLTNFHNENEGFGIYSIYKRSFV